MTMIRPMLILGLMNVAGCKSPGNMRSSELRDWTNESGSVLYWSTVEGKNEYICRGECETRVAESSTSEDARRQCFNQSKHVLASELDPPFLAEFKRSSEKIHKETSPWVNYLELAFRDKVSLPESPCLSLSPTEQAHRIALVKMESRIKELESATKWKGAICKVVVKMHLIDLLFGKKPMEVNKLYQFSDGPMTEMERENACKAKCSSEALELENWHNLTIGDGAKCGCECKTAGYLEWWYINSRVDKKEKPYLSFTEVR